MTRNQKLLVIAAGYLVAVGAGVLAGWAYDRSIPAAVRDASSGMYSFGTLLAAAAAFGIVALLPTVLALVYLRPFVRFWRVLSVGTLVYSGTGLVFTVLLVFARAIHPPSSVDGSMYALMHMLGVPLWAVSVAILAALAPEPGSRGRFVLAFGLEVVIAILTVVHFAGVSARD